MRSLTSSSRRFLTSNVKAFVFPKRLDLTTVPGRTNVLDECVLVSGSRLNFDGDFTKSSQTPAKSLRKSFAMSSFSDEDTKSAKHAAFFEHGTLVGFNLDEKTQEKCLEIARKAGRCKEKSEFEDYQVEIDGNIEPWSEFQPNKLVVQVLDVHNVAVIASVLSQSVSLREFERQIDVLLQEFESGKLAEENVDPLKALKDSNQVLAHVILELGLLDRPIDSAWQDERYHKIWLGMRDEFEIDRRWKSLQTKATFLQDNLRFAVEYQNALSGKRLEIAIIALIFCELIVSFAHLQHL